ncbi:ankyrin repeat domain-containing protein [Ventosimonas gracilis]|uniref:ankyrin repeat domain-containing protein n=1 Tax=Ventosimonas gracilis TaxID=1680762 RepID=UPI00128F965C|nr:hypothetical protein [Ventosimonas gracilis]
MTNKRIRATEFFKDRYLLMAQAIEQNNMAQLKQLARGQDLSQKGDQDMDLLWFAIARKNFDAIRTLVELGVDPEKQAANGIGTALDLAFMMQDDTRYLEAVLDGGLSPNYADNPPPMLHRGVAGGLAHVKLLLQRGTRLDDRIPSVRRTALLEAITRFKPDVAIYLLQQGADFNAYTVIGVTPAWAVYLEVKDGQSGHPVHTQFLALRDLMIEKGAQWPPDSPLEVREQMRARGETPLVPPSQTR